MLLRQECRKWTTNFFLEQVYRKELIFGPHLFFELGNENCLSMIAQLKKSQVRSNDFSVGMGSGGQVYLVNFFSFFIFGLLKGLSYCLGKN